MNSASQGGNFVKLLKDYMTTARGTVLTVCTNKSYDSYMLLKNGACLVIKSNFTSNTSICIPGEANYTTASGPYGMIFLDTNGDTEPNTICKDQFYIPMDINGIVGGD